MSNEVVILEPKPIWKKQRFWGFIFFNAGAICAVIPGVPQVVGAILMTLGGGLGWKGASDALDRTENMVKAEIKAQKTEA